MSQDILLEDAMFYMTINGDTIKGEQQMGVVNPAYDRIFAQAPNCTKQELDLAISAAKTSFSQWSQKPISERRVLIKTFASKIIEQVEPLAILLTMEQGKILSEAREEILGGAAWLEKTANIELPQLVSEDSETRHATTIYEPIGVVAGIVPWNYPVMLAMFKVGPALLAGNTMILKPSPTTPLTTLKIGEIANEVFPKGVLNVVSGDDRLGPWLTEHEGIDKISFTGSTPTGKKIMEGAAPTLKKLTLELGGNDASIVMPGVPIEALAEGLFWAAFTNAGQVCIATKRLYVHSDIYEPLKNAISKYAKTVRIGDGLQEDTQIGPLQNLAQYDRVKALIAKSKESGLKFIVGGEVPKNEGFHINVCILDNPPKTAPIVCEEQFGPILPMIKFTEIEEVIQLVNDSDFGLGAMIWSMDFAEAQYIASQLDVGTVWINEGQHISPTASFGGHKQSGIGSEGALQGLLQYTKAKTIFTGTALGPRN